jgi:hypothetical protein
MSSADFGFMTLRNMTAYQTNGGRVKQNYLMTTSTNGAAYFSDTIRLSSINVSTLGSSTIITSTIFADTIDVNTLSTTTHVSNNILASSITLENYVLSPIGSFSIINTSSIIGPLGYISSLSTNSISTNTITSNYLTATYISSMDNLVFIDNNNSTIILTGQQDDLYVNGYPVVTEGNISSISSLYWEDTLGTGSLAGAIFNKNLGAGSADYMVGVGTGPNLNGTLSVQYTGGNVVGNSFHISSNKNYTYLRNAWDGANNGLAFHLEENQATCCGPRIYLAKSYNFQSSIVGDLGAIKFNGTNGVQSSILGAEITAQQTGVPSTFVPADILFINGTSSVSNTSMIIKDSGNVGIGTTAPNGILHIQPTSGTGDVSTTFTLQGYNPSYARGQVQIRNLHDATLGAGAAMAFFTRQDSGSNFEPSSLVFERMRITQAGNVGIGTTTPQYTLDVLGNTRIQSSVIIGTTVGQGFYNTTTPIQSTIIIGPSVTPSIVENTTPGINDNNYSSALLLATNDGPTRNVGTGIALGGRQEFNGTITAFGRISGVSAGPIQGDLTFETLEQVSGVKAGLIERMRIKNNGNVGIGTDAPGYKLHVAGTLGITDKLTVTANGADITGVTQINWGPGSGRIGTTTVNEGFAMTWNAIQAGGANGQTELISGKGGGPNGGFDFFVNVADGGAGGAGNLALRIDGSTKNVGIGTTTPAYKLDVVGTLGVSDKLTVTANGADITGETYQRGGFNVTAGGASITGGATVVSGDLNVSAGNIYASGNITAGSDIRFKTDIKTIENALSTVNNMRGVSYTAIATQAKSIGVIAQEVEKVLPEVVLTDDSDDKFKSVAYGNIIGLLIEAIKELNQKIDNN